MLDIPNCSIKLERATYN